jgi:hypothetical protein
MYLHTIHATLVGILKMPGYMQTCGDFALAVGSLFRNLPSVLCLQVEIGGNDAIQLLGHASLEVTHPASVSADASCSCFGVEIMLLFGRGGLDC